MNIKIDNMIDLRAFCLEQAVKIKGEYAMANNKLIAPTVSIAKDYEEYTLGNASLPDQPFNLDKLLYDTMTEMIKNKESNRTFTFTDKEIKMPSKYNEEWLKTASFEDKVKFINEFMSEFNEDYEQQKLYVKDSTNETQEENKDV